MDLIQIKPLSQYGLLFNSMINVPVAYTAYVWPTFLLSLHTSLHIMRECPKQWEILYILWTSFAQGSDLQDKRHRYDTARWYASNIFFVGIKSQKLINSYVEGLHAPLGELLQSVTQSFAPSFLCPPLHASMKSLPLVKTSLSSTWHRRCQHSWRLRYPVRLEPSSLLHRWFRDATSLVY